MVRCLEFENITYTKNAESADRIKQVCEQNYGFIIPLIAKKLLQRWNDEKDGRHSAISWFLSQGVPLHIVQARAGHQDPKITLSAYSHVAKDDADRVANLLDSTIFSAVNE